MKKYSIFILVLVLTAALFTGCGCTNRNMNTTPTVLPTNEENWTNAATTAPTTQATTAPTTQPTEPSQTIDRGNGPLEDPTVTTENGMDNAATDTTSPEGRASRRMPQGR